MAERHVPTQEEIADRLESTTSNMSPAEVEALAGTRANAKSMRMRTKALLDKEPKVSVYIPEGVDEYAAINGYGYHMKAGTTVEVPAPIARLLHAKWAATQKANKSQNRDLGTM